MFSEERREKIIGILIIVAALTFLLLFVILITAILVVILIPKSEIKIFNFFIKIFFLFFKSKTVSSNKDSSIISVILRNIVFNIY